MSQIIIPVILVVVVGLIASIILAAASRVFFIQEDPKFILMRAELPGANCGGCGYAGCDDYAHALVDDPDGVPITKCAVGGPACAEKLAEILGKSADGMEKNVAYVMCNGTTNNAQKLFDYADIPTCKAAKQLFGGSKACPNGCLGLGDCEAACDFDAIHVIKGVALVNRDKCVSCSACVKACPNNLIKIVPEKSKIAVRCHNSEKGADARKHCSVACIGCGMCQRTCKFDAIHVENNVASIDPAKCKMCGMCVVKCPTGAIQDLLHTKEQLEKVKTTLAAMEAKEAEKKKKAALEAAAAKKAAAEAAK